MEGCFSCYDSGIDLILLKGFLFNTLDAKRDRRPAHYHLGRFVPAQVMMLILLKG